MTDKDFLDFLKWKSYRVVEKVSGWTAISSDQKGYRITSFRNLYTISGGCLNGTLSFTPKGLEVSENNPKKIRVSIGDICIVL